LSSTGNPNRLHNDSPDADSPDTASLGADSPDTASLGAVSSGTASLTTDSLRMDSPGTDLSTRAQSSAISITSEPNPKLGAVKLHTDRLKTIVSQNSDGGASSVGRHAGAHRSQMVVSRKVAGSARAKRAKGGILNIVVLSLAAGLVGTMAIPAYAFNPTNTAAKQFGSSTIDTLKQSGAQSVAVGAVDASSVSRDPVTATSEAQLSAQKAAAARAAVAANFASYQAAYTGPSASDYLANPPYPSFSLAQVFQVAQQYIGDPYVFGGATPAGFDCSGYVMFVYAQFGIALPHSVSGIAARGTRISIADAVPGDLIVMPGHIGFYAGNGEIMDAPDSGKSISIRPIWTTDYYVVRLGI
jgi:peptidoglycan DL-endopeptidase CwlO